MEQTFPNETSCNCLTVESPSTLGAGISICALSGGGRGIRLSPRSAASAGVALSGLWEEAPRSAVSMASIARGHVAPWSGERRFIFFARGVYEVEHLRGRAETHVRFHDGHLSLAAGSPTASRGRHPTAALFSIGWEDDEESFLEAPVVRLRRTTGELAVGLSSVQRDRRGWPLPWISTLHDYRRTALRATEELERELLRRSRTVRPLV
jgi:hypothetical protein